MRGTCLAALAPALLAGLLGACSSPSSDRITTYQPAPGSNEVLRGPILSAVGAELVTGDLVVGPSIEIPRHYHHGEEFLYVLGGSVTLYRPGQRDLLLGPGEAVRIAPGVVHHARSGPDGLRAVSNWVVPEGQPLRVPVTGD